MKQPIGYEREGKEHLVCRLKKSIYTGQAGLHLGFCSRGGQNSCFRIPGGGGGGGKRYMLYITIYIKMKCSRGEDECPPLPPLKKPCPGAGTRHLTLTFRAWDSLSHSLTPVCTRHRRRTRLLHWSVHDMILAGKNEAKLKSVKDEPSSKFDIKDLGKLSYFLGMSIICNQEEKKTWMGQPAYTEKLLTKVGMSDCRPVTTPMESGNHLVKASEDDEPRGAESRTPWPFKPLKRSMWHCPVLPRNVCG